MKISRSLAAFATAFCIGSWHAATSAGQQPDRRPPNVVLVVSDDMGYGDLGCYGSKQIKTPAIDRLAKEGVRLTDCYANAPICSPTRAALMTGRYPHRAGFEWAIGYGEKGRGLSSSEPSLPRMLKQSGYRTALFGKWHLGYDERYSPIAHGFDEFFGFLAPDIDYYSHKEAIGVPGLYEGTKLVEKSGYMTDLIAERALDFIDKNAERPFFLEIAFNAPHFPFQPPGKPEDARTKQTYGPTNGNRADYIQMVEHMDRRIGEILDSIERHKLGETTLVLFVNDNGGERLSSNAPFKGSKLTVWEGGIRVPCVVRWPGVIAPGTVSHQAVITMDLTATILAACKVKAPAGWVLDGIDVLPMLTGKAPERERTFFWRVRHPADRVGLKAVRHGRFKYLTDGTTHRLFDLETDPGEARDLSDQNRHVLDEMKRLLSEWEMQMPPVQAPARARIAAPSP